MKRLPLFFLLIAGLTLVMSAPAFAQQGNNNMATIVAKADIMKPPVIMTDPFEAMVVFGKIQVPKSTGSVVEGTCTIDENDALTCTGGAISLGPESGDMPIKAGKFTLEDGPANHDYMITDNTGDDGKVDCVESSNNGSTMEFEPAYYPGGVGPSNEGTLDENGGDMVKVGGTIYFDSATMGWFSCDVEVEITLTLDI